jgi:hypothetical protein
MRACLLGWPGQVGIFFERKRFFERTLFEQKFLYIYKAFFSFKFLSKFVFFSKERLFERTYKNSAFRTNGIRKKKMNFERTLFEQTTSSRFGCRIKPGSLAPESCVLPCAPLHIIILFIDEQL